MDNDLNEDKSIFDVERHFQLSLNLGTNVRQLPK